MTTQHISAQQVAAVFEEYAIEMDAASLTEEVEDLNRYAANEAGAINLAHKHAQVLRAEWDGDMHEAAAFADS